MSCTVEFSIPGKPQPKQRARVPRNGNHGYTPDKTKAYEQAVGIVGMNARPKGWPKDAQFVVTVDMYFPDLIRRDGDNVLKAVLDGLNNVLWDDDHQVVDGRFTKRIDRKNPRTDVQVSVFEGWSEGRQP